VSDVAVFCSFDVLLFADHHSLVPWSDGAHREAAVAANDVIEWTTSALVLLDSLLGDQSSVSPAFISSAQNLRTK
jgi:hypothetical protein